MPEETPKEDKNVEQPQEGRRPDHFDQEPQKVGETGGGAGDDGDSEAVGDGPSGGAE